MARGGRRRLWSRRGFMQDSPATGASMAATSTMRIPHLRFNLHHLSLLCCLLLLAGAWYYHWPWYLPALGIVLLVLLVADGIARPASSLFYPTVSHGPRTGKRVALTFDDGPDPEVTP